MTKGTWAVITVAIIVIILGAVVYMWPNGDTLDTAIPPVKENSDNNLDMNMNVDEDLPQGISNPSGSNMVAENATGTDAPGQIRNFTVAGSNFKFLPNEMRVKKGDTVRVTFRSESGMHDFKIDEFSAATKVLKATDAAETIEFVADKSGQFEFYCSVGTHRAMGMVGKLIVTE